jgi:hypothetical protein
VKSGLTVLKFMSSAADIDFAASRRIMRATMVGPLFTRTTRSSPLRLHVELEIGTRNLLPPKVAHCRLPSFLSALPILIPSGVEIQESLGIATEAEGFRDHFAADFMRCCACQNHMAALAPRS